jgi:hypothetical protein
MAAGNLSSYEWSVSAICLVVINDMYALQSDFESSRLYYIDTMKQWLCNISMLPAAC